MCKITDLLDEATEVAIKRMARKYTYQFGVAALRADGVKIYSYNEYALVPTPPGHAEARAAKKLGFGAIMAVVRLNNSHKWLMARPCERCQAYMLNRGVERVLYSIGDQEYGVLSLSKRHK